MGKEVWRRLKTSEKIEDTGLINQRELVFYRITGKALGSGHSLVARQHIFYCKYNQIPWCFFIASQNWLQELITIMQNIF